MTGTNHKRKGRGRPKDFDRDAGVTSMLPKSSNTPVQLSPAEEAELERALKEADDGDFLDIDAEEFLDQLERRR